MIVRHLHRQRHQRILRRLEQTDGVKLHASMDYWDKVFFCYFVCPCGLVFTFPKYGNADVAPAVMERYLRANHPDWVW